MGNSPKFDLFFLVLLVLLFYRWMSRILLLLLFGVCFCFSTWPHVKISRKLSVQLRKHDVW